MPKVPSVIARLAERFIKTQSSSSILLALCTGIAMIIANSAWSLSYLHVLEMNIFGLSLHHWINDGLMAIFFFVIGMEIKREIIVGELSSLRKAALPVFAAIGGMIVPALIYYFMNPSGEISRGWAIPMATDIAFALGVLALFGPRVPLSLKVFLLALAIVDDLGAVLVIATVYSNEIKGVGLLLAFAGSASIFVARSLGVKAYLAYVPLGILVWIGILYSGVHATIAGVLIGLMTPYHFSVKGSPGKQFSPLDELIHKLHPWVSFAIMPIFALANAGVPLANLSVSKFAENSVSMGVFLGLLLGKPIGILAISFVAVQLRLATRPTGLKWSHLTGAACLAGIGFTMAIFIVNLSLPTEFFVDAKFAILLASVTSALVGYMILAATLKPAPSETR